MIPIAIALWSKRRYERVAYGAYFLLRRVAQTTKKRLRLREILKLINRIFLFLILVLIFAEPLKIETRVPGAGEGFSILLDVGRNMQVLDESSQRPLIELQFEKLQSILSQMPSQSRGSLFFVSESCEVAQTGSDEKTAFADNWIKNLKLNQIPFKNESTTDNGFQQCLDRSKALFGDKKVFMQFISSLPNTLSQNIIEQSGIEVSVLPQNQIQEGKKYEINQTSNERSVRFEFLWDEPHTLSLIHSDGRSEILGRVERELNLSPYGRSWLWIDDPVKSDPWAGDRIQALSMKLSRKISLWAEQESEGLLSLRSALRSLPGIDLQYQIGGIPTGENLIIYGSYTKVIPQAQRLWFFVSPDQQHLFGMRDKKQWSASFTSGDVRRGFEIRTSEGIIFIKKYALFDLDPFLVEESFEDGAPSLLRLREATNEVWVSPFDLEDLTTDLTLEPTFIPYLYRHLDLWFSQSDEVGDDSSLDVVWTMPGQLRPVASVVQDAKWPGVYGKNNLYKIVQPIEMASGYLDYQSKQKESGLVQEKVSLRSYLFPFLVASILLELFLCAWGSRALVSFVLMCFFGGSFVGQAGAEPIRRNSVGYFKGIDSERKRALEQFVGEFSRLSNLDFAPPEEVSINEIWKYALVVGSSSSSVASWTQKERQQIRDYLDRGGLIVFDDPLAVKDSQFSRSVRKEMKEILPGRDFKIISRENVLFRTFYLLQEVAGRRLTSPYIEGIELDGRWVAVFSSNDLLGAVLKNVSGEFSLSVSPYGMMQRRLSSRLLLNFFMYSVTVDYKDDAIHLPHILKRRVR